jgi:hypothetical protein
LPSSGTARRTQQGVNPRGRSFSGRVSVTAALASTAALAVFPGAAAAAHPTFPAGVACSFGLQVDVAGGDHRVDRTFVDANGNPVRMLSAGVGFASS